MEPHDEKQPCHNGLGNQAEDCEEWPGHGTKHEKTLSEIADALLDDMINNGRKFSFRFGRFVGNFSGNAERRRVKGCLGDEAAE